MSSYSKRSIQSDRTKLIAWYKENERPLPWRKTRDPYKIWISEVMCQQTTVKAVIPYYERFIKRFPTFEKLASARLESIYEQWAGLGYYSRARMLHKAAKELKKQKTFPNNHKDLLQLPGFGDYTARAVASISFGENVGVVDGNVIRVLSRRWDLDLDWWKTKEKRQLQELSDLYASEQSQTVNQAMMELGATICTPKSPTCLLCPWKTSCLARKQESIELRPKKKARKPAELWQLDFQILEQGSKIAFIENNYAPFLKGQMILPGQAKKLKKAPKKFHFKHGITHHNIFVTITRKKSGFSKTNLSNFTWYSAKQLKEKVPFSLIQKAIDIGLGDSEPN